VGLHRFDLAFGYSSVLHVRYGAFVPIFLPLPGARLNVALPFSLPEASSSTYPLLGLSGIPGAGPFFDRCLLWRTHTGLRFLCFFFFEFSNIALFSPGFSPSTLSPKVVPFARSLRPPPFFQLCGPLSPFSCNVFLPRQSCHFQLFSFSLLVCFHCSAPLFFFFLNRRFVLYAFLLYPGGDMSFF